MFDNIYKRIYKKIKEYNKIVIARHISPDPDALGSTLALKDMILNKFPNKEVYVVGASVSRFKYLGKLDKLPDDTSDALLIVTDTPDLARIDKANPKDFKYSIKIDHHPFIEKMCDIELIDEDASSASQLITELAINTPLKLTKEAKEKLFLGIVGDTNRFMHFYSTSKTFEVVAYLLKDKDIDITELYEKMYLKPLKDKQIEGYILNNLNVTENGVGYLLIDDKILKKYGVDKTTARNSVNEYNFINELLVWAIFTKETDNELKGSIRSRGPVINNIAENYNGGGHIYASGVKPKQEDLNNLINDLDQVCKKYKKETK